MVHTTLVFLGRYYEIVIHRYLVLPYDGLYLCT
jgi:hypothetical protein